MKLECVHHGKGWQDRVQIPTYLRLFHVNLVHVIHNQPRQESAVNLLTLPRWHLPGDVALFRALHFGYSVCRVVEQH